MKWSLSGLHKKFALSAVPVQIDGLKTKKIPCCWLISNEDKSLIVKLNDSSMAIWQMCDGKNTVRDIINTLQAQFPDASDMDKDIQRALDELLNEALIEGLD